MPDREDFTARYRLLRELGSGGMGTVWLARDEMLDREVAIKELRLPPGMDDARRADLVTRAVREAQATARIRHPSVVALHDVAVHDGKPWIVMELLRGDSLAGLVEERGPLPPRQAAALGAQLLDGLAAAHARGIQHRDVKPGNVFLTSSGRAVLTDFGIAKLTGESTLTQTGLLIGSPGFIAPERLDGEPGGPASDLWSLGATLYYGVEGVAAYEGEPVVRLSAALSGRIRPPRLAGPLEPVLAAMMAREPAARPDAGTARWLLTQVAEGRVPEGRVSGDLPGAQPPSAHAFPTPTPTPTPTPAPPGPLPDPPATPEGTAPPAARSRSRLWIAVASAACLVAAAAGAAVLFLGGNGERTAFTGAVDFCSLLTAAQVREITRVPRPPAGAPYQGGCAWTVQGSGVALVPHVDDTTAQPWAMSPDAARELLAARGRSYEQAQSLTWEWKEIGAGRLPATATPRRAVPELGEDAFAHDLASDTGATHTGAVYFRVLNLVVEARYSTLSDEPTDADIRDGALKAARWARAALQNGK
ncbi:serine/threonine protein kinase [Planomonospora sp. ID67723]|uniref:serine/threonine-protein kinase n=1 Tax=Planomonospora sp. ID67723 TaxID=2738134 RepID=UPI0018C41914|nr:serine/threonine-protein kinase [Planomonospora sp. ID67723]MBG0832401.1 serine/threonine protein kinase [Planomonospora sp. ID67723]